MKTTLLPTLLVFCGLLTACETDMLSEGRSELVVEGWIGHGEFPVVMLTRTMPVSQHYQDPDSLANYLLRWATVRISDGSDTVTLTGRYDEGYFPPYVYTTGRMRGRSGQTYTLTVDVDGFHATATTTVPPVAQVEACSVQPVQGNDSLFLAKVRLHDDPTQRNFYQLFTRTGSTSQQFLAAYQGSLTDEVLAEVSEVPVYQGRRMGTGRNYTPYFVRGDSVAIKVTQVDAEAFRFWDAYCTMQAESGNAFVASPTNLPGNVTGAYGCWYGLAATMCYFVTGSADPPLIVGHE